MHEIKTGVLGLNDRIPDCGFSVGDDRLKLYDLQKLVIPKLSSPSYIERQEATKYFLQRDIYPNVLYEALKNKDPNISKRVVELLDTIEFKDQLKVFLGVGDQNSLEKLKDLKTKLRGFRERESSPFPDERSVLNEISTSKYRAKIYTLVDVEDLFNKISAFKPLEEQSRLSDDIVHRFIRTTLLDMVADIARTPENIDGRVKILKSLGEIDWSNYNETAMMSLLSAIEDLAFRNGSFTHPKFDELLKQGMDARGLLGLHPLNLILTSDRQFFKDNIELKGFLGELKDTYQDYLILLSETKSGKDLNNKGELLFYYQEFVGAAASCHGHLFNKEDSPIFCKFVEDFREALRSGDIDVVRNLYNENIDIIKITRFDKEELCCDWDVGKYRSYMPLLVDKVLRHKESRSYISEALFGLYQLCSVDDEPSTGITEADLLIEKHINDIDQEFEASAKDKTSNALDLIVDTGRKKEALLSFKYQIASLQDDRMPKEIRDAYLAYLEIEVTSLGKDIIDVLNKDRPTLNKYLERVLTSDSIGPETSRRIYQSLVVISNNIHSEYTRTEVRLAKQYKKHILDRLRTKSPDTFKYIKEAWDFVLKVDDELID